MVRSLSLPGVDERSTSALLSALRESAEASEPVLIGMLTDGELRSLATELGLPPLARDRLTVSLLELSASPAASLPAEAQPAAPAASPPASPSPLPYAAEGPRPLAVASAPAGEELWLTSPEPWRAGSRRRPSPAAGRLPGRDDEAFVAIDFETADAGRDSACAVALVRVEQGRIVRRAATLLRPPRPDFPNAWVHGITLEMVTNSPTFAQAWPGLEVLLDGAAYLVAHNAPFDRSVLRACCAAAGLSTPPLAFECTLQMARRLWSGGGVTLPALCQRLGISLRHHDAASDAEACAMLVLAARSQSAASALR